MLRAVCAGLLAATITYFGVAAAEAQTTTARPTAPVAGGRLTARAPDLRPIPSRIEHGVVSVRNTGSAASVPSVITVNCHLPGEEGGCVDVPDRLIAPYEDGAFPNMLVVQVPAIQPGARLQPHADVLGRHCLAVGLLSVRLRRGREQHQRGNQRRQQYRLAHLGRALNQLSLAS